VHLLAHFFVLAPEFRIFRNQTQSDLAILPPRSNSSHPGSTLTRGKETFAIGEGS
jgi:hypothetical protein